MNAAPIELHGVTWNHTRGVLPMVATAQRFEELHPNVRITWEKRSLQAFADEPIDALAARFDLLVIDHPWAGFAARSGVIVPLEEWLPAEFLADQERQSVGRSHESYRSDGKQVALAIDAATPVASARGDLFAAAGLEVPDSWAALVALAAHGRVAVPSIPQDTLMNFYMLCSTLGEDVCTTPDEVVTADTGLEALRMLRELSTHLAPWCFDANPIRVYEQMTQTDDAWYCPFAYGYANYARVGYARRILTFMDTVRLGDHGRLRTTLGGTGLAISASSPHKALAAEYARYVASPEMQAGYYVDMGGQPGHRTAWVSDRVNELTAGYFANTLPTLERAYLRPRYDGHMYFQDRAGAPIREYLMHGGDEAQLLRELNELYRASLAVTSAGA